MLAAGAVWNFFAVYKFSVPQYGLKGTPINYKLTREISLLEIYLLFQ